MKETSDVAFKLLQVVSWIIFIGLCIESGGFIFNTIFTLSINAAGAGKFWTNLNFSSLYQLSPIYFAFITGLMIIVSILKAFMFYLIVHLFHQKKLSMSNPFNSTLGRYLFRISYLVLGIGLISLLGTYFTEWIEHQGVPMPSIKSLHFAGADVWLFMGVTLYIFAKIFAKGIVLQSDHELTV